MKRQIPNVSEVQGAHTIVRWSKGDGDDCICGPDALGRGHSLSASYKKTPISERVLKNDGRYKEGKSGV